MSTALLASSLGVIFMRLSRLENNSRWDTVFYGFAGLVFIAWAFKEMFS